MAASLIDKRVRCPLCDEWYEEFGPRHMMHQHPEPQSGPARDDWLKSGLSYERWITETYDGMVWDKIKFKTDDDWYEGLKKMAKEKRLHENLYRVIMEEPTRS